MGNPQLDTNLMLRFQVRIMTGAVEVVAVNVRDSATNTGPVGGAGEVASALETLTPNAGVVVLDSAVSTDWRLVTMDLTDVTVSAFTGNGTLDNQWCMMDSIRLEPVSGQTAVVLHIGDGRPRLVDVLSRSSVIR